MNEKLKRLIRADKKAEETNYSRNDGTERVQPAARDKCNDR